MRIATKALIFAAFTLAVVTPLHAQTSRDHTGIAFAFGAGAGWARVSCDVCQTSRDLGPSAFLRIGTNLRPGLNVGAELTGWTHEVETERENLGALMAMLLLHPRRGPLYVKGGFGYMGYRAGEDFSLNSIGLQLGAGYELKVRGLAVNNYVNLLGSSFGSLKNESTTIADDVSTTLVQFGVGLSLR